MRGSTASVYSALLLACVMLARPSLTAAVPDPAESSLGSTESNTVILIIGAPGSAEYLSNFVHQASTWREGCAKAGWACRTIGLDSGPTTATNDLELVRQTVANEPKSGPGQLWFVLIGHGSFDNKEARFNLRGPDLTTTNLALWLKPFQRPLALIDTSSSSAPFLNRLSARGRVLVTATRSGAEQQYTHFGPFFAEAISSNQADLDKDGQVSILEAFLVASRRVAEFYKSEGRIATEHALLDDNGDGLGTPADWFVGIRAIRKPQEKTVVDGALARTFHLLRSPAERELSSDRRARRDALENAVFQLRERKASMPEPEYYSQLEKLLLALAEFYHRTAQGAPSQASASTKAP